MDARVFITGVLAACAAWGQTAQPAAPAPGPTTAPREWGRPNAGLSASAAAVGGWVFASPLKLDFALRNTGQVRATLPGPKHLFGYLLIGQGKSAHYTEKIFHAAGTRLLAAGLASGNELRLPAVDVGKLKAYSYMRHLELVDGYPAHVVDDKPQPQVAAGKLGEVLRPGPVRVRYVVYLDRGREGPLRLIGGVLKLPRWLGDSKRLSAELQRQVLDDLNERMRRDAWGASLACADAIRIGTPAIPAVARLARAGTAKDFTKLWAATALCGIGGAEVEETLIELLADTTAAMRHVVAYHGLRARSKKVEGAIMTRALGGKDPMVTAWAIMGYLKFRKTVPEALLAAGLKSEQWKVRAAVVETVTRGNPNRSHLPILRRLVQDEHPPIRQKAAEGIRYVADRSHETIEVLVTALLKKGETAREAVAETLCSLTGNKWPYLPAAGAEDKQQVIKKWQQWWEETKQAHRKKLTEK